MKTLPLREWRQASGLPLSVAQRDLLRARFAAKVEPTTGADGRYDVTPTNRIGAAVVDGTAIIIEPKVDISNVMFLVSYAVDASAWQDDVAALGSIPDLVTAMAGLYTRLTVQVLRRGLLAGYHPMADASHTVRGRIDLAEQLRRRPGLALPLAVTWQEYDDDIIENQLLLAAARLLRPLPIRDPHVRHELRRIIDTMQHVTPVQYQPGGVPAIIWTRLNQHYRPAVELARLLLQHTSVDLTSGTTRTPMLILNMADVFETFVRTALRRALAATEAQFPPGKRIPLIPLDTRDNVRLYPDLSYWQNGRCRFVGDVKYKRDTGDGHSPDLYQLLAYATATGLKDATLIYADGPTPAGHHDIRRTNISIRLHHLNLNTPPAQILAQLTPLAVRIREAIEEGP